MGYRIRDRAITQVHRLQRVAAPVSILLLSANLGATAYSFISWRGINAYAGIALMTGATLALALLAANVYTALLRLHESERAAQMRHDPTQIYAFTPFQSMMAMHFQAPLLRQNGRHDLARQLESWALQGFIPRDAFHPDLLHHYPREGRAL